MLEVCAETLFRIHLIFFITILPKVLFCDALCRVLSEHFGSINFHQLSVISVPNLVAFSCYVCKSFFAL